MKKVLTINNGKIEIKNIDDCITMCNTQYYCDKNTIFYNAEIISDEKAFNFLKKYMCEKFKKHLTKMEKHIVDIKRDITVTKENYEVTSKLIFKGE